MKLSTFALAAVLALGATGCATQTPAPALTASGPRHLTVCTAGELKMQFRYRPAYGIGVVPNANQKPETVWTEEMVLADTYMVVGKAQEEGKIFCKRSVNPVLERGVAA